MALFVLFARFVTIDLQIVIESSLLFIKHARKNMRVSACYIPSHAPLPGPMPCSRTSCGATRHALQICPLVGARTRSRARGVPRCVLVCLRCCDLVGFVCLDCCGVGISRVIKPQVVQFDMQVRRISNPKPQASNLKPKHEKTDRLILDV